MYHLYAITHAVQHNLDKRNMKIINCSSLLIRSITRSSDLLVYPSDVISFGVLDRYVLSLNFVFGFIDRPRLMWMLSWPRNTILKITLKKYRNTKN